MMLSALPSCSWSEDLLDVLIFLSLFISCERQECFESSLSTYGVLSGFILAALISKETHPVQRQEVLESCNTFPVRWPAWIIKKAGPWLHNFPATIQTLCLVVLLAKTFSIWGILLNLIYFPLNFSFVI